MADKIIPSQAIPEYDESFVGPTEESKVEFSESSVSKGSQLDDKLVNQYNSTIRNSYGKKSPKDLTYTDDNDIRDAINSMSLSSQSYADLTEVRTLDIGSGSSSGGTPSTTATKVSELVNDKNYQTDKDVLRTLIPYAKSSEIPTKVSQLTNDEEFQTSSDVATSVNASINKIIDNAPDNLNTLGKVSSWITTHSATTSSMSADIQSNTQSISTHVANNTIHISSVDRTKWDNKSDFDGKYTSLTDTPTIPTVDVNKEYVDTELTKKVNVADMPTKVSTFTNDSKYQTETDVTNTLADYAKKTEIPVNVSALANDSNFITNAVDNLINYYTKTETYTQAEVNKLIGNLSGKLSAKIVTELPTETAEISTSTMYLIEDADKQGTYSQYMYIDNAWASLGKTTVDLTNYYDKTEVDTKLADKADKASIPVIPTNISAFTNDSGYLTEHQSLDGYAKTNEIPTVTNDLTNELKANYDLAYTQTHTHSNKELLDNLTAETIAKYDNAVTNTHAHTNSDVLNTLSADNVTNWDKAYTDSHTHSNKDELDSLTKSKLDEYDNAVTNAHIHTNKAVLDNFSQADDGTLLYNNENIKGVELDDEVVSKTKVWSSSKVDDTITPIAEKAHTHTNQDVIDKFSEDTTTGDILYNNKGIGSKVWTGTKAAYEAITTKDSNTTYIVTDEEETLADYVIDDTVTDTNTTWSSKKINDTYVVKSTDVLRLSAPSSSGTTTFTFDLSKLGLPHNYYHYKVYVLGNGNVTYFAEGGLGQYNDEYNISVDYKNSKISSIDVSGTVLTITTIANYYIAAISIKRADTWLIS